MKRRNNTKKIVFFLCLFFLLIFSAQNRVFAQGEEFGDAALRGNPGYNPTTGTITNPDGTLYTGSANPAPASTGSASGGTYQNQEKIPGSNPTSDFPSYLKQIIGFMYAVIGIAAMFMLCIGAYQYLLAAGNLAKVDNAKETIRDALWGLVLGLLSFVILREINPDLVSMKGPSLGGLLGSGSGVSSPGTGAGGGSGEKFPPADTSKVNCNTVRNYDGFMNKNFSDGLYNETNVNSAQDLQNVLTNIRTTGNGLTQYSDTIYQACQDNKVPVWYALGTFAKESNMFSEGSSGCSKYNNPGCMRANGQYINYATPEEGIRANIENMGRRIQENQTPLGAWAKWYPPDDPGNCEGAPEYLNMFKWTAGATGVSGI